ncbi:MAG TPA: TetR/AcrR family transcriptional regulator [Acidimicrobiia bacterium]|nr:TetR/AcrR family transcriptional regulator [Acidimicrobiia bacterium]
MPPDAQTEPKGTKDRILDATAALFMRYGYTGSGLKQIVADANAPFGSLYHHFPGGKQELGVDVIHRSGALYGELVMGVFDAAPDILTGVRDCFEGAAAVLVATDYADACPIETVALEVASSNETLRLATAEVFESWIAAATVRFRAAGLDEPTARTLSISFVNLLEGAFILCRAARTTEALEASGKAAATVVEAALRNLA